jgi:branched-chain amino acid transport system permease protein
VIYPDVMPRKKFVEVFGYEITNKQVLIFVTMVLMYVVLDRFVKQTRIGKGIRAVAQDPETAALMGVDINGVITWTFFVGGLMAGAAGFLYGLFFGQTQFNIGFIPGIKAFTAAVLGGIGNIRGALLGGLLLGLVENLGVACLATQWQDIIAFLILVAVLMFRPTGILGERVRA